MQKWTQSVDAIHHSVEVSRLDAMDHDAEVQDAANVHSDVAVAKKKIGATDHGAELGTTYLGAELDATDLGAEVR